MNAVILILTIGLVLLSVSQILTVRIFLRHLEILPKKERTIKPKVEDVNDFGESIYKDISEITPEEGIKSIIKQ